MPASAPPLPRTRLERAVTWLYTGPLGHLYSVVADLAGFFARSALRRARRWAGF